MSTCESESTHTKRVLEAGDTKRLEVVEEAPANYRYVLYSTSNLRNHTMHIVRTSGIDLQQKAP